MYRYDCKQRRFVIQEHNAYRAGLHYDLRIEARYNKECILESWAVRNLPKLISGESNKVLMIQQPDHDLSWLKFEGNIPKGEYGGGSVKIYDRGTYKVINESKSSLVIEFNGKKLKGRFAIVKTDLEKGAYLLVRTKEKVTEVDASTTMTMTTSNTISTPYNDPEIERVKKKNYMNLLLKRFPEEGELND